MKTSIKGADPGSMLRDLKTNRRLQAALVALALMIWYLWPSSAAPVKTPRRAPAPLGDRQTRELRKLPDLDRLAKAGELPTEDRMLRDIFLFEGPPPPPRPPRPGPPPPPPAPEETAARELAAERARQAASRPQDLRYLGYLGTARSGRLGAFMKGEEPLNLRPGDLVNPQWRLVKVSDLSAEFQNVTFADLRHRIDAVEARIAPGRAPSNEF